LKDTFVRKFPPPPRRRQVAPAWIGYALTALWIIAIILFFWLLPATPADGGMSLAEKLLLAFAIVFPVALIWAAVVVAQTIRAMRQETAALRSALDKIGRSVTGGAAGTAISNDPALKSQLAEIAALTRQTDHRISTLAKQTERRPEKPSGPRKDAALRDRGSTSASDPTAQPALPLSGPDMAERMPISIAEFIRALDFPKNPDDREGFRILRRAMEERRLSKLLSVAQDLLSVMSQDGIYMDDLHPDLPMARVWRRFANGERGLTISALGGIRDRAALTLIKSRMKSDAEFRDKVHNFLREFDTVLRNFEQTANDIELNAMATTRTARAFMLLGRVAGTFD
jgi:hypothetical protein